jgi:hypothetical protein
LEEVTPDAVMAQTGTEKKKVHDSVLDPQLTFDVPLHDPKIGF